MMCGGIKEIAIADPAKSFGPVVDADSDSDDFLSDGSDY
jgi:hypothetical protein